MMRADFDDIFRVSRNFSTHPNELLSQVELPTQTAESN